MMLIAGSIFMLIFSFNLPVFYIDNFIFQLSFVLINIYLSIPLFKELVPPNFDDEEKELFKKHFKKFLKPSEFKHLLSTFRRRVYKVTSRIVNKGNGFSSIFFIAKMPSKCRCSIEINSGRVVLDTLKEYSWVGIVEYMSLIKNTGSIKKAVEMNDTGEWLIDCQIIFDKDQNKIINVQSQKSLHDYYSSLDSDDDEEESITINSKDYEIVAYEWDLESLNQVFIHKTYGSSVLNGLHAMWLKHSSGLITKLNENISDNLDRKNSMNASSSRLRKNNTIS